MFKKSDILPLILASLSTVLLVSLGFLWLTKSNIIKSSTAKNINQEDSLTALSITANVPDSLESSSEKSEVSAKAFVAPYIVPQGTSITINGSRKMVRVNQELRKSFHQKFPGTVVNTNADGNQVGINLLASGEIDIAAIDRPLDEAERASGLAAIKIDNSSSQSSISQELYYAYRMPASSEVEVFLGYVLSPEGQLAVTANSSTAN